MYNELVRFAATYTKDKDLACSIVQDSFVKLWKIRETLDPGKSLRAYLYQVVRNRALNQLRDTRKEVVGLELVDLQDYGSEDESAYSDGDNSDLSEHMDQWIDQLPERQREAFELSRFDGLDHNEIAQVMQVSARTVNNHIVAALKHLRSRYDAYISEKSKLVV